MQNKEWKWNNFEPAEIACYGNSAENIKRYTKDCGCGGELFLPAYADTNNKNMPVYFIQSMDALQRLREAWGKPIILNSAHRCEQHNKRVGGAKKSCHLAIAFDCVINTNEQETFVKLAKKCGFNGIGIYPRRGFVHLDIRSSSAEWVK